MEQKPKPNLETAIHQELKSLPERRAPANLIPSVLAAIQVRAALPWYQKPWQKWPRGMQIFSVLLGLTVMVASAGSAGWAWQTFAIAPLEGAKALALSGASSAWNIAEALAGALSLAARSIKIEVWIGIGCLIAASYATCIGAGAFVYHLVKARD